MTHVYAYIKEGCSGEQLKNVISGIKDAVNEGFNICSNASTVAVKELPAGDYSDNFGAFVLVYTAKGKGFDVKKRFAKLLNDALAGALPESGEIKMVMKEQANDMVGLNGVLRCNAKEVNSGYEAG
ncbi:MAG: 4-oxalocrotonate tautomerase family protein [Clostridium sp.]|nr:4-oxalocrotonate tautomerase family protein [Clostridium sp.]